MSTCLYLCHAQFLVWAYRLYIKVSLMMALSGEGANTTILRSRPRSRAIFITYDAMPLNAVDADIR